MRNLILLLILSILGVALAFPLNLKDFWGEDAVAEFEKIIADFGSS